jgi:hypothetical protein
MVPLMFVEGLLERLIEMVGNFGSLADSLVNKEVGWAREYVLLGIAVFRLNLGHLLPRFYALLEYLPRVEDRHGCCIGLALVD